MLMSYSAAAFVRRIPASYKWGLAATAAVAASVVIVLIAMFGQAYADDVPTLVDAFVPIVQEVDEFEHQKRSAQAADLPSQF